MLIIHSADEAIQKKTSLYLQLQLNTVTLSTNYGDMLVYPRESSWIILKYTTHYWLVLIDLIACIESNNRTIDYHCLKGRIVPSIPPNLDIFHSLRDSSA
jgi:hypothetical protein